MSLICKHILVSFILTCSVITSYARGIVIYKNKIHQADNYAKVLEYKSVKTLRATTIFSLTNGQRMEFTNYQWHMAVPFEITQGFDIVNSSSIERLLQAKTAYANTISRFPQTKNHLQPEIKNINFITNNWSKGNVRIDGTWLSKAEYKLQLARDEARKRKRETEAATELMEQRKLAAQQKIEKLKLRLVELNNKKKAIGLELKDISAAAADTAEELNKKLDSLNATSASLSK